MTKRRNLLPVAPTSMAMCCMILPACPLECERLYQVQRVYFEWCHQRRNIWVVEHCVAAFHEKKPWSSWDAIIEHMWG